MDLSNIKPLEIGEHLGKVKNRVALVGVELEGGWVQLPTGVAQLDVDGSVFDRRVPAGVRHIGELPIGPALPAGIPELIRINHPQKVNHTCGMHVHMSFDSLWYYQLLMVPEYQITMIEYLTRWAKDNKFKDTHHIWARLRGESQYCRNEFWPDIQSGTKRKDFNHDRPGHRYTHVHYCGRQRTIEIRTLPMMDKVKLAVSAVQEVISITNACLYVLGKQHSRSKVVDRITLPNEMVYEETIIDQL